MKKLLLILLCLPMIGFGQQNPATSQGVFDINGVRTSVGPAAFMWDLNDAKYEVPKGFGKHSIFAHEYWMGGIDDGGQLRVAAMTYRQSGNDFWAGPVSDSAYHNPANMNGWEAESEAERIKKERMLQAKENFLKLKEEHENNVKERERRMQSNEDRIRGKEKSINQKWSSGIIYFSKCLNVELY